MKPKLKKKIKKVKGWAMTARGDWHFTTRKAIKSYWKEFLVQPATLLIEM